MGAMKEFLMEVMDAMGLDCCKDDMFSDAVISQSQKSLAEFAKIAHGQEAGTPGHRTATDAYFQALKADLQQKPSAHIVAHDDHNAVAFDLRTSVVDFLGDSPGAPGRYGCDPATANCCCQAYSFELRRQPLGRKPLTHVGILTLWYRKKKAWKRIE